MSWIEKYTGEEGSSSVGINQYVNRKSEIVVGFSSLTCDFVCTGDGVADDAVQINAAIDYCLANGFRKIKLRYGIYYQKTIIDNDVNSLIIEGEGWSVYDSGTRIKAITAIACQAKVSAETPGGFMNLRFDGNNLATDVLRLGHPTLKSKGITLFNIVCMNVTGYGITVNNSVESGAWDDSIFYNVFILDCDKGFRNFSTRTTFMGGSISGCATQALETPQFSSGTFVGTVFSTNAIDVHFNGTDAVQNYVFVGCYFEDCTTAILKRTGSELFMQSGFHFEECFFANDLATSSPCIDTTNMRGVVSLKRCHFQKDSGGIGSRKIEVDSNVHLYYEGVVNVYDSGFVEIYPTFTGDGQVHISNKRTFYVVDGSETLQQAQSGATIIVNTMNATITLPSAIGGLEFAFVEGDAHTITVNPASGDNVDIGGAQIASSGAGKGTLTLKCLDTGTWAVMAKVGTWTTT